MEEQVAFDQVQGFVRLLSHDVRNDLNAIDLLTAYLQGVSTEEEVVQELRQVRASVQYASRRLSSVTRLLQDPVPEIFGYPLRTLFEDFQAKLRTETPEIFSRVCWEGLERLDTKAVVAVDGVLVFEVLQEMVGNAAAFSLEDSNLRVGISSESGFGCVRITQSISPLVELPKALHGKPFQSTRQGHYGLGLFRARRILASMEGRLLFDSEASGHGLVTSVFLPEESSS